MMEIDTFFSKMEAIASFQEANPSSCLMFTKDLKVIQPLSCYRFFASFRFEPLAAVHSIRSFCEENETYFREHPIFLKMICFEVLDPLDRQTFYRYPEIQRVIRLLSSWIPQKPSHYLSFELDPKDFEGSYEDKLDFFVDFQVAIDFLKKDPFRYRLEFSHREKGEVFLVLYDLKNWKREKKVVQESRVAFPGKVFAAENGLIEEIEICTKKEVGRGVQNAPLLFLDLLAKRKRVQKQCFGDEHWYMLRKFHQFSGKGIVPILSMQVSFRPKKMIFEEPFYPITLQDFLMKYEIDWDQKLQIAISLLEGLYTIHQTVCETNGLCSIGHGDIKPLNIVVKDSAVGIIDFGSCYRNHPVSGTYGYLSPEEVVFWDKMDRSLVSDKRRMKFRDETGKTRDIWAMGLVFLRIFADGACFEVCSDRVKNVRIPPIREVKDHNLFLNFSTKKCQESIDSQVEKFLKWQKENAVEDEKIMIQKMFDLLFLMLKVDYQERITALSALEMLLKIEKEKKCS